MTGTAAAVTARPGVRGQPLRWSARRRHPQWWLFLAAAAGWVLLAVLEVLTRLSASSTGTGVRHAAAHGALGAPVLAHDHGLDGVAVHGAGLLGMVLVMTPLVTRNVRYAALRAPAAQRGGVVRRVTGGWCLTWVLVLVPVTGGVLVAADRLGAAPVVLLATAGAVAWQWSPRRRRSLARCHRVLAPPLSPRAARGASARFGLGLGATCAATCGPMMVLMAASGHALAVGVPLVGIAWYERRRRPHHDPLPALASSVIVLAGTAALVLAS